ncbi:MAG: excinuclease ABC subunit UvrC [Myxococcota bacterium]
MTETSRRLPEWLEERLRTAPREPGVYIMRDRSGTPVYIGKAVDLKARLKQYFAPNPGDTRFFVGLLDRVLGVIDVIVTSNNKEALVLENELIKRHKPRFNVKLRDDKTYLSLRIGREHPWPRVEVVRRRKDDGADYFGPYDSASAIRNTLRVLNRHFRLRTCRDTEFKNRSRPCLEHQIGRCPAPCVLDVDREDYEESLQEAKLFLQGRGDDLVKRLRERMERAAERLEFELAAHYRDQVEAIDRSLVKQNVHLPGREDLDVVGLYREGADGVLQLLTVRGGVLMGSRSHVLKGVELPDEDVLDDFLTERYSGQAPIPDRVLVPVDLEDAETWSEILGELRGRKMRVYRPQRGDKKRLLELAEKNAREAWSSRRRSEQDALKTLERLRKKLHLRDLPTRIECYDISNIQGTDPVGSMVVAVDGEMAPREYRHFKIRGPDTPDDFRMMYEVLSRRFKRGQDSPDMPDLLLIDGGKGQLEIAVRVLDELGVAGVEVASLAKMRMLDARGHIAQGQGGMPSSDDPSKIPERVFRPGRKNPVVLKPNSNALYLLQRLRDEAHRFAITHHRKRRRKRTLTTALDAIPGIGPSRRKALLRHFGSLERVRGASVEEIAACPGLSEPLAERVHEALHP